MMAGWSPGRLNLAGPTPDLFTFPPGTEPVQDVVDEDYLEDPPLDDDGLMIIGATDVPGGCVITQPWGTRRSYRRS